MERCIAASWGWGQVGSSRLGFVGGLADNEDPVTEVVGRSQGSSDDLVHRMRLEVVPWGSRQSAFAFRSEQSRVEDIDRWWASCDGFVLIPVVGIEGRHKDQLGEAHS